MSKEIAEERAMISGGKGKEKVGKKNDKKKEISEARSSSV